MNWPLIISEIKAAGLTLDQIAERIGGGKATLSELSTGKIVEPKWSRGDALLKLHDELCMAEA